MSRERSNFSCRPLTESASAMSKNQLIDSLTSHISLYTSHTPSANPNPRSSILKWFSSLTVHQRQACLTAVDPKFVKLLIQMLARIAKRGGGTFIILPDLPSGDLPGLCYRQSSGLLSRAAESNVSDLRVFDTVRLFSSREGEDVRECSVSVNCLDTMTVEEELVGDLDLFVETMDGVSNGEFLRGEISELGEDWVELDWLKAKGYYSIAAFVVNRLELALRLGWLSSNNGKRRGVKLKEKVAMVSTAANVFWRKKACIDWWCNLDPKQRQKALSAVLGKSARTLSQEILREANKASEDNICAFPTELGHSVRYDCKGSYQRAEQILASDAESATPISWDTLLQMPRHIASPFKCLFVLKDVAAVVLSCRDVDCRVHFFSSLSSVSTISDCIHRKLRGFLTVLYLDFTKHELLEEKSGKSLPNKVKERSGSCPRKKKGKSHNSKRVNHVGSSFKDPSLSDKPFEEISQTTSHADNSTSSKSGRMPINPQGDQSHEIPLPEVKMEVIQALGGKDNGAAKKTKRGKRKNRNSVVNHANQKNSKCSNGASSVSDVSQNGVAKSLEGSHNSTTMNVSSDDRKGKSDFCASTNYPGEVDEIPESSKGDATDSTDNSCITTSEYCQSFNFGMENPSSTSSLKNAKCKLSCEGTSDCSLSDTGNILNNENISNHHSLETTGHDGNSAVSNKQGRVSVLKDATFMGRRVNFSATSNGSSSESQSQEWPSVSNSYFPSANSHLPPATDRLHLDVGRNWQNHFRQPFLPTVCQTRNTPTESNCKQVLARPLPMSLDWPPMVQSASGLASPFTRSYDSRRQSPFHQGFTAHSVHLNVVTNNDEKKYFGDLMDKPDPVSAHELGDEFDGHWISEEELEVHGVSGLDYSQYFGGGIMYWDPSDLQGSGFSRPPSLSSDDSCWAWQEADMNRNVDDMVAFSSSYSTNGLASPTAAPFCSPFDPLSSGHQTLSFVRAGSDVPGTILHSSSTITDSVGEDEASGSFTSVTGDVDVKSVDSLPYPVLRPIIIPNPRMSRSKRNHELKSPRVPPARGEQPRLKRPPSPVVLCVPRAPRPPPPSPVGESRKHRGFPTVRSGSSSPRHWGVKGWYHDSGNLEENCLLMDGAEVVFPSWSLSAPPVIKPIPGTLLQDHLIAISQLARDQEHPDVAFPLQPPDLPNCPARSLMHNLLHDEIDSFCKQVASENLSRKPYINWAVKRVTRSLQVLWPRSRTNVFGSYATGLSLPTSDVDLVVSLPPVRNLEPIKEAGILEGRNGIKETCLQHAARYLANQEWVKNDSLKTVENTAIPIIMLEVEVPRDLVIASACTVQSPKDVTADVIGEQCNPVDDHLCISEDSASPRCSSTDFDGKMESKTVRVDISFKSASHTGVQTTKLVRELTEQFPAATPLALLLKQFLADRSLDHSYSGGLSSYCLILLITRFLQHEHHLGRSISQNTGSLLVDFLYFFGNVFDPRQMRVSVRGSGLYMKRERGYSIDPIHVDDPLFPTNNVGRNCFRIHQCIKAFSEAYTLLEQELSFLPSNGNASTSSTHKFLPKIIPTIDSS